ncbi:uncharacterized protein METZ01_LOCUS423360, partial [marine metagenome]
MKPSNLICFVASLPKTESILFSSSLIVALTYSETPSTSIKSKLLPRYFLI